MYKEFEEEYYKAAMLTGGEMFIILKCHDHTIMTATVPIYNVTHIDNGEYIITANGFTIEIPDPSKADVQRSGSGWEFTIDNLTWDITIAPDVDDY